MEGSWPLLRGPLVGRRRGRTSVRQFFGDVRDMQSALQRCL